MVLIQLPYSGRLDNVTICILLCLFTLFDFRTMAGPIEARVRITVCVLGSKGLRANRYYPGLGIKPTRVKSTLQVLVSHNCY